MKAFSLVELTIALWIMTAAITAVALASFWLPTVVQDAARTAGAIRVVRAELAHAAASSNGIYSGTFAEEPGEDASRTDARASVSWKSLFGTQRTLSLEAVRIDPSAHPACDPFVSGDWYHPKTVSSTSIPGAEIAALAATPDALVVALESASSTDAATLLFYALHGTSSPELMGGIDAASTSRIGFSSVAASGDEVFAGNAFASRSAQTCSGGAACAQVQAYSIYAISSPELVGTLSFATSSEPYALAAGGTPAAVRTLMYKDGLLYAGLYKTASGDEFNIIDARDPAHLAWVSGIRIGRTVNDIQVRDGYAFVSTDDPSKELLVLDVHDPAHPAEAGSWNASGSASFGYGSASTVHAGTIRFGRTYTNNGSEFELLDARDPSRITLVQHADIGTVRDPESVRTLLTQDWLTFALLTHRLTFWNTGDTARMAEYAPAHELPAGSTGAALACRNNLLYLARNTSSGGIIDVLSG